MICAIGIGGSRGGLGGTCPPRPLEMYSFYGVILFTFLEVSCQIGLLFIGPASEDKGNCCYYPPPTEPGRLLETKEISATTPAPVSCCAPPRLPALDPPLHRRIAVVSAPAWHAGDLGSIPGPGMLCFRCKNLALNIIDCVSPCLSDETIYKPLVPSI